ncbi:adenosylcobinamide-GDP ribazoletransferase, partial [Streptomyces scabiei]|uniref:adenosylcobinamide-GDP ribazoletransferase n=1 Tax=Streptomyces scabiei TaxID=1930 RepID=UPI0029ADE2C4
FFFVFKKKTGYGMLRSPVGSGRCIRDRLVAALVGCAAAGAGALSGPYELGRAVLAVVVACGAAELLLRHCVRRFGGVTGDVFGALAETAATAALVVFALG